MGWGGGVDNKVLRNWDKYRRRIFNNKLWNKTNDKLNNIQNGNALFIKQTPIQITTLIRPMMKSKMGKT